MGSRVGADVGGTFTDVIVEGPDGRTTTRKVLSTPPSYDKAVTVAIDALLGESPQSALRPVQEVVHGTTVATNAILERRGAHMALVTTEGFRDVLELRRVRMPHLYNPFWRKPPPIVERRLRFEIGERMLADGTSHPPGGRVRSRRGGIPVTRGAGRGRGRVPAARPQVPGPRGAGGPDTEARTPRGPCRAVQRGPAGAERVRTVGNHRTQRLRDPDHGFLRARSSGWPRGDRGGFAGPDHAVVGRRDDRPPTQPADLSTRSSPVPLRG